MLFGGVLASTGIGGNVLQVVAVLPAPTVNLNGNQNYNYAA